MEEICSQCLSMNIRTDKVEDILITTCNECTSIIADHSPIQHDTSLRAIPKVTCVKPDIPSDVPIILPYYHSPYFQRRNYLSQVPLLSYSTVIR
jgi:hypothetical protein